MSRNTSTAPRLHERSIAGHRQEVVLAGRRLSDNVGEEKKVRGRSVGAQQGVVDGSRRWGAEVSQGERKRELLILVMLRLWLRLCLLGLPRSRLWLWRCRVRQHCHQVAQ